ncbi:phytoene desaturase family protein [Halocalculus aciditolerans]|uniref:Phytoene dehydrogenase n=1 Tax=Halocalculus aciditolerans TaxID=1383812 RepID=A0A830F907_9EURY|nr:phytoene desaturase family protein [Halocalculus aciditolerans]GGL51018.1 phytoene dehydrogenase [Halocalculus aciditolerans]
MQSLAGTDVAVVGGGFGGLSAACYLADAGADVTLLEKNEQLGGRASLYEEDGFRFDMGPSWYLMPDVFERFFDAFDRVPEDYFALEPLDPHYRVFWKDGDRVDMTGDVEEVKEAFESYEAGAGDAFEDYLAKSEENYEVGMEEFVYTDRSSVRDFLDLDVARNARGLTLLGSMRDHVGEYFDHPKLRQLVQYSLVFLGGSPENTPALYNLMTHVDVNLGVYYPEGGMNGVARGIAELARELGVETRVDCPVEEIHPGYDRFTLGAGGETVAADVVVSDADYAHTEQALLPEQDRGFDESYWASRTWAPSAFLLYLGVDGDIDPLEHHTLVLPEEWDGHFAQIFDEPAWPDDPAYYVCAPSVTDDSVAPEGCSNLFVLVPVAPGLDDAEETREAYRDAVLADLAEHTGVDVRDRIRVERTFAVSDFAERYNAYEGTALGLAHTLRQTALFRPPHRSKNVEDLYFTGGNTTPGIGVPMCLISGEHVAAKVAADR